MALNNVMLVFSFLFGLILGSFLNVCIYRIPRKESIVFPPSKCTQCGNKIRSYDNIPLLSYLFLLGRCRHCKDSISMRYPIVELITGLLCVSLLSRYGIGLAYFLILLFTISLIVITFIDLRHQIIPDVISLPNIPIGFIASFTFSITWLDSLIGILAGGGVLYLVAVIFEKLTGKEGMGGGDIKLLAMIGAWMGWKSLPFILLTSSLSGAVIGGVSLLLSRKGLQSRIPFGPFLAFGTFVYLFFGQEILNWYIHLISL